MVIALQVSEYVILQVKYQPNCFQVIILGFSSKSHQNLFADASSRTGAYDLLFSDLPT
jgi:hypothetical protein